MKSKLGLLALGLILGSISLNGFGIDQKSESIDDPAKKYAERYYQVLPATATDTTSGLILVLRKAQPKPTIKELLRRSQMRAKLAAQGLTLLPLTKQQQQEQAELRARRELEDFFKSPRDLRSPRSVESRESTTPSDDLPPCSRELLPPCSGPRQLALPPCSGPRKAALPPCS